ncbi:MAG: leucine-rich repeat protein [Treponema sp.]|nr:leucine-rich repeat protein [Treponema sp.]
MIKRIITVTLLVCLVLGAAFAQEKARDHIAKAQEFMKEQNYEAAVASYEAAKRIGPWNNKNEVELNAVKERRMDQLRNQADGLFQAGNYNEAIEMYTSAMKFATPTSRNVVHAIQARIVESQAAVDKQVADAQAQSAQERTATSRATVVKGNDYFTNGQFAFAVTEYENAVKIGGLNPAETTEANRLITEAKNILAKIESYNRNLRDEDFNISQNASDGKLTITKYNAAESKTVSITGKSHTFILGILDVVIPARLHDTEITIIGPNAFKNTGITSVVVPEEVIEIGAGAFSGNRLEKVTFGSKLVKILGGTPEGQKEVTEEGAFEGNHALAEIIFPNTLTEIGARAFKDCGLINVKFGATLTASRVVTIYESAFRNNKLTELNLPPELKTIHRFAFNKNQIQTLQIPSKVELVYQGVFTDNPLTTLIIPASLSTTVTMNELECPRIGADHAQFGNFVSAFPESVTRVTLPAAMHDSNMLNFPTNLRSYYISQNRAASVYTMSGQGIWRRQ